MAAPAAPSPRQIAQSLVLGEGLPGLDGMPDVSDMDEVRQLVEDGPAGTETWLLATGAIDRWRNGIEAAIVWLACRRFVEQPDSFFSLGRSTCEALEGQSFDDVLSDTFVDAFDREFHQALTSVTSELAAEEQGERFLRVALLMRNAARVIDVWDRSLPEAAYAASLPSKAEVVGMIAGMLHVPAMGNLPTMLAPVSTIRTAFGQSTSADTLLDASARSVQMLSQLTGLDVSTVVDLRSKMFAEKGSHVDEELHGAWHPDWTDGWHSDWAKVTEGDNPLLVANAPEGDRIMDLDASGSGTAGQVGMRYRSFLAREEKNNRLHAGCLADVPLSGGPDEPAVSGVRMLSLRLSHALIALSHASEGGSISALASSPVLPRAGRDAFDDVILLDHQANVTTARNPRRRTALEWRCPVSGRRSVIRHAIRGENGTASAEGNEPAGPSAREPGPSTPRTAADRRPTGLGTFGLQL
jgi:hypothetical protein